MIDLVYVNFIDSQNRKFVDKTGYNFLVRSYVAKKSSVLTAEDIKELVDSLHIKYTFYLYSLYENETVKEDLTDYILEDGTLSIEYKSGVRRNLSIGLYNAKNWLPTPTSGFLWKGSKFKLDIGVSTDMGEYVCPAGIFILKSFDLNHQTIQNRITLEMVDKFGGLDGTVGGKIPSNVYIPRGSNILQVVKSLLKSEKIYSVPFDPKVPILPARLKNITTPHAINESNNSTIGALIIKLLTMANLEPYYNEYGQLCVDEMRENMLVDNQASIWTFSSSEGNIHNFHSLNIDFQKVENVIIVEGANFNGDIVGATVKNTNAKSPTNISIYEPTVYKLVDENISSNGAAELRAEYELFKRSLMPISQEFSTIIIPSIDVNKVITIDDEHCGLRNVRFLINSVKIPISSTGKMTIKISNIEEVAFSG